MTSPDSTLTLERVRAETADLVIRYLDSLSRDSGQPRTALVAEIAAHVALIGAHETSLGPAWELAESWETAHRVVAAAYLDDPCPCDEHTPGTGITLANLARLAHTINADPDMAAALAAIEDEEAYPRPDLAHRR